MPNLHGSYLSLVNQNDVLQASGAFFVIPVLDARLFGNSIDPGVLFTPVLLARFSASPGKFAGRIPDADQFPAATKAVRHEFLAKGH